MGLGCSVELSDREDIRYIFGLGIDTEVGDPGIFVLRLSRRSIRMLQLSLSLSPQNQDLAELPNRTGYLTATFYTELSR